MNTDLLKQILVIETESEKTEDMQIFLLEYCETQGYEVQQDGLGSIYVTKGKAATYPCLVAHMDTVHEIHGNGIKLIQCGDKITGFNPVLMQQTGIGGDDKCGIYAALHCLLHLEAGKAAFFVDEEIGCVGSFKADLTFFKDCRFILQADRRGKSDFITSIGSTLSSKAFQADIAQYLKQYGFACTSGSMSDVMALNQIGVGISCANMSAGYYHPHCADEYIDLNDLQNTCNLMLDICSLNKTYKFQYQEPAREKFKFWSRYDKSPRSRHYDGYSQEEKEYFSNETYGLRMDELRNFYDDKEIQKEMDAFHGMTHPAFDMNDGCEPETTHDFLKY